MTRLATRWTSLAALLLLPAATRAGEARWPSFRGAGAAGVADGVALPDRWHGESGEGIAWTTRIPGLAHSSPILWDGRVYVTTAVSSLGDGDFRHGLYGDGDASDDRSLHRFLLLAVDLGSGDVLFERELHRGVPKDRRHVKATYANQTPTTDGEVIVAAFGSEGIFATDMEGRTLWHRDLGRLDVGAYDAPDYEWGAASSPVLWRGRVLVQCDTQGDDFLIALDSRSGETVWRASRDELPSWGTPTVVEAAGRVQVVTNGSNFIRGYDATTGVELWRLGGSSKITAPTPIFAGGLIVVASGRSPERPIFAIRPGAVGDLTLAAEQTSSQHVAWHLERRGPYMPTPLAYGDLLYVCGNRGDLACYRLATGEELYRRDLGHRGGGFSASPVAADGRIYLPSEDGEVFVVRAGETLAVLAQNPIGERLMATPALGGGTMVLRGQHRLFAVRAAAGKPAPTTAAGGAEAPTGRR